MKNKKGTWKALPIKKSIFWRGDFRILPESAILYVEKGKLLVEVKHGRKQNKQTTKRNKKQSHKR